MNIAGIMHVPLSKDAYMIKEDTLVICLRAARGDLKKVTLFYGDRVDVNPVVKVTETEMNLSGSDGVFDYFEAEIKTEYTRVCYYFYLTDQNNKSLYYSEYGFTAVMDRSRTEYFQFPYLRKEDMIVMPEWTKDMIMYHIFPDSFADGHRSISASEKEIVKDGIFYRSKNGGTLKGITKNLDYICDLGANCIYINPIFKANSCHKYDTVDYFDIDPCFGTIEDLKTLVKEAHGKGIRIILDGVFNHCGPDFFAFKDVLKKGEKSNYVDWFYKLRFPIQMEPYPNYEAFAYVPSMPKLNTGNPEVVKYCCDVGRFWIRECDIDGWRMDVANEINHEFFREFKKAIREEKSDCFLIGEIWEDSGVWLQGDQFDSTMNYTFTNICEDFFAKELLSVTEFDGKMQKMIRRYPRQVALAQMNFLDTHDIKRFLSACKNDEKKFRLAFAFMMCAPGIPSVFYGDEKGIAGETESDYRKPMGWNNVGALEEYCRRWIHIRRNSKALSRGSYRTEYVDDNEKVYVFSRTFDDEKKTVIINADSREHTLHLEEPVVCAPQMVIVL